MAKAIVEFQRAVQSLEPLNAAAYRMLGLATCEIGSDPLKFVVTLEASVASMSEAELRQQFLAIVTDENLRAQIARRTDPVRDLILALAFGSLAQQSDTAA